MTDAPNGWPDPQRPGVPANPEKDGWHALRSTFQAAHVVLVRWRSQQQCWEPGLLPRNVQRYWDYEGPMHTPAEVAAREAAAAQAMLRECVEAAARAIYAQWHTQDGWVPWVEGGNSDRQYDARRLAWRAMPDLALDAIAREIAAAEARGMERAAGIAKDVCDDVKRSTETPHRRALEDRHLSEQCHQEGRWHGAQDCAEGIAAAVERAAREAGDER